MLQIWISTTSILPIKATLLPTLALNVGRNTRDWESSNMNVFLQDTKL